MAEDLGYRLQRNAEESERLVLDRGRSGQRDERIVQCDRRDDGIAHQGREIGQRAEAMHRQPIRVRRVVCLTTATDGRRAVGTTLERSPATLTSTKIFSRRPVKGAKIYLV